MDLSREGVIKMIEETQWLLDDTGTLNLLVMDFKERPVHCWLEERPYYCDRGHIKLMIDGHLGLDEYDSFPRYFFSFEEADRHTRTFLKWRIAKHREDSGKLPLENFETIDDPIKKDRG